MEIPRNRITASARYVRDWVRDETPAALSSALGCGEAVDCPWRRKSGARRNPANPRLENLGICQLSQRAYFQYERFAVRMKRGWRTSCGRVLWGKRSLRSEEHTSEVQSRQYLVC